jgi:glycosyltransferase involved in cell wall biosynthesis
MKELYVIIYEKIYGKNNFYYCENKDIQSIINYLSSKYNLIVISRFSALIKPFRLKKVLKILRLRLITFLNFFLFLFNSSRKKKILIISITPFNFLLFLIFKFFFNCKFYLYLRSDGYQEYRSILGKNYVWIYHLMLQYISKYCKILSCHKKLYKKSCHILRPSELTPKWNKKIKKNYFSRDIIKLLYVGRFKIEKGIYSLLKIFSLMPENIVLTLVGSGDNIEIKNNRIRVINFVNSESKLINLYDLSNIIILPSYTEAHPKVIDEALARMRPVIVFDDIKHVIDNRYGVFSVQRDTRKLIQIINFIKKNNHSLHSKLKKNNLPQKQKFLEDLNEIISFD